MPVDFLQKSAGNSASTTLSASISDSDTSFPLTSDTNFLSGGGLVIVDEGQANEELAYYTSKSGSSLTVPLANRGLEGGSAQAHNAGATVKGIFSADMWNNAMEALALVASTTTGELNKATGAEINTGTEDEKIVTPKAITDSYIGQGLDETVNSIGLYNNSMARQAIINGNFDVWQRGTSFASQANIASGYTADRWHFYRTAGTTEATLSRQTAGLDGSVYSCRVQRDNSKSTTQKLVLSYGMESSDSIKLRGKKLTLSFWAKCGADYSATSSALISCILSGTGTDQNILSGFTDSAVEATETHTLTTSWQKFTCTTSSVIADTKTQIGCQFQFTPTGTASTNDWFEVTQVQLCAGDVALPFMPKSFEEELRACQRYYEKSFPYATAPANGAAATGIYKQTGSTDANGSIYIYIPYKVPKRTIPLFTAYNSGSGTAGQWQYARSGASASLAVSTDGACELAFIGYCTGTSAAWTTAYLLGHWTADAEL